MNAFRACVQSEAMPAETTCSQPGWSELGSIEQQLASEEQTEPLPLSTGGAPASEALVPHSDWHCAVSQDSTAGSTPSQEALGVHEPRQFVLLEHPQTQSR